MIKTQIIKDSINPQGSRLTTSLLTYPRFMHSEFMTHRVFSRNSASSRAIPVAKLIRMIQETPCLPEFWGANQKGMQANGELDPEPRKQAMEIWDNLRKFSLCAAEDLQKLGLHKQLANRVIELWMPITVIATGSDKGYQNFFSLRAHKDALPEFQVLSFSLLQDYITPEPQRLDWNDWHIPYGDGDTRFATCVELQQKLKVCTARCARLSYLTFDGEFSVEADEKLHDSLALNGHMSPFEHCAQAINGPNEYFKAYPWSNFDTYSYKPDKRTGHYLIDGAQRSGWGQYRKAFEGENRALTSTDLQSIFNQCPQWIYERIQEYKRNLPPIESKSGVNRE